MTKTTTLCARVRDEDDGRAMLTTVESDGEMITIRRGAEWTLHLNAIDAGDLGRALIAAAAHASAPRAAADPTVRRWIRENADSYVLASGNGGFYFDADGYWNAWILRNPGVGAARIDLGSFERRRDARGAVIAAGVR